MEMVGRIRRMYLRDELSLHEIAKRTGLSRNTVRSWLRPPQEVKTPVYSRTSGRSKLSGYTRVTDFVQAWRADTAKGVRAFVPLKFELGEAFQFDGSEEGLVVGGIYHRMQVSHMKLCASRAFWLVVYPSQGHKMLFDTHTRSFAALGGVTCRGSPTT